MGSLLRFLLWFHSCPDKCTHTHRRTILLTVPGHSTCSQPRPAISRFCITCLITLPTGGGGGEREALLQHSSCTGYLRLLGAVTIQTCCSLPTLSYSTVYVCRLISGGVSPPQELSVIYGYYPILCTSILFLPG